MPPGAVAFVLHAHLPFVRHPEHDDFLEERWLFEAITECYLPLLHVLAGLERDRVPAHLTLSLSPTLLAMLSDALLQQRCLRHIERSIALAEREVQRTRLDPATNALAQLYLARFRAAAGDLRHPSWHADLVSRFRALQDAGVIEIITTAATHAVLPLLHPRPQRLVQLALAAHEYRRFFGRDPGGLWLPECAYEAGLDRDARAAGFRYAVLDAHGLAHATPRPVYDVYAPVGSPAGLILFGRDPETATQVWSAATGYPGDPWYRDFHRDIGFDLPDSEVAEFRPPGTPRVATGIKYHRVTAAAGEKAFYQPARAAERVQVHARDFVAARRAQVARLCAQMDRPPLIVSPYDAELFGHWWFEGPAWLDAVLRRIAATDDLVTTTLSAALEAQPVVQAVNPSASTWGEHGHQHVWLSERTDWIYPPLHAAGTRLQALCQRYPGATDLTRRALTQALRELLLAQASDWPFMVARDTAAAYATTRVTEHLARCATLCDGVDHGTPDAALVAQLEATDNLFPALDYRVLL